MATTYRKSGEIVTCTAPAGGVTTGVPVMIGSLFGIPQTTAAEGVEFELMVQGEHELTKTSAQAWTEGQKIFWNTGTSKCDSDSTTGPLIGVAVAVAANPSTTGIVRLNGSVPSTAEGEQGAIVALTDNTGGSGTHDDTLADGLTATAPAAITDYTAVTDMTNPVTKTEGETMSAALATLESEVTALRSTVAACVTDITTQNQNASDLAQKINEIRTALIAAGIIASS
jgi:predicted RecA/RadA family phage recombinase